MSRSFASARSKLNWADHHAKAIETKTRLRRKGKPYIVRHEFNADRTECRFYVSIKKPIPQGWGLISGDSIHNARAALDHLVWELSETFSGSDPTDTDTQFPIYTARHATMSFADRAGRQIGRLPTCAQALVEQLQPYHAPDPMRHPLRVCQYLDNIDKHKIIPVVVAAVQDPGVALSSSRFVVIQTQFTEGPFVNNAQVGFMRFADPVPPEVQVHTFFSIVETLSERPPYLDAYRTLQRIVYYVGRALDVFETFPNHHEFLALLQTSQL